MYKIFIQEGDKSNGINRARKYYVLEKGFQSKKGKSKVKIILVIKNMDCKQVFVTSIQTDTLEVLNRSTQTLRIYVLGTTAPLQIKKGKGKNRNYSDQ